MVVYYSCRLTALPLIRTLDKLGGGRVPHPTTDRHVLECAFQTLRLWTEWNNYEEQI